MTIIIRTQQNGTQNKIIQHKITQHKITQHNNIQHYYTQHIECECSISKKFDTELKNTLYRDLE